MTTSTTPAKIGDTVRVEYTGKLDNGTVFDTNIGTDPLEFVLGAGQVIPGFDEAVVGMSVGSEKTVTIQPPKAYGDRSAELVQILPRDKLPKDVSVGMALMVKTPEGQEFPVYITAMTEAQVTLDLNSPLAGKTLQFTIKLLSVK